VQGDERWLRQVLANLLDNAIKFTPTDGKIFVNLTRDDQDALITVLDSGPGVPEGDLPHIFERFYQGDSARTRDGRQGSGLGLAIAAWIVAAHGGSLVAANRSDEQGCCLTLLLPLRNGSAVRNHRQQ
jgi:signal transduction histidine kinase